ncbi:hypothetical protein cu1461 [Corynebacterium urealyticum DSM 7109]|uniref:Uncharacterized protein n=1 Tax=Corynebacterium urealyticum (strain ATCC 43042 / DSM 7109) TaxID=504474 RepID=B1VGW4_CORU7|nr:hypothetical protein cu1461 [Corynebacterium urealyticum DSM 7109]
MIFAQRISCSERKTAPHQLVADFSVQLTGSSSVARGGGTSLFLFSHRVRRNGYEVERYAVYKPKGQRAVVCLI